MSLGESQPWAVVYFDPVWVLHTPNAGRNIQHWTTVSKLSCYLLNWASSMMTILILLICTAVMKHVANQSCFILDWGSAMMIILAGTKEEHLNMLEGGIIAKLLEEKWTTFAQVFN